MKVEDALKAMSCLDGQQDGTPERAALITQLCQKLLEDPENFWEEFFSRLDAEQPNSTRNLAMKMLLSGEVDQHTTFEEAHRLIDAHYAPSDKQ